MHEGELNEIQEAICCCLRVAGRACTVAAGNGTGQHAIHHHDDDTASAFHPNAEHHDYDDSGNSAAKPNHSDEREHHEVQAPSQEGKEGEANDDHYHAFAAVIPRSRSECSWVAHPFSHGKENVLDRKSTRLNSSHANISYA